MSTTPRLRRSGGESSGPDGAHGARSDEHEYGVLSLPGRLVHSKWFQPALVIVIVIVGAVITWNRVPGDHRDRFWAEDGSEFFLDGVQRGPWSVVFTGYTGYQQFIPRIVIGAVMPFTDLTHFPVVIFAVCSVLTGAAAAAVFWLSRDIAPWLPARLTLAGATLFIPLATQEVIGNLADFHTYAMWVMPWLLLYRPRNWWSGGAWAVLAFALVMTEIQTVFFVFLIAFGLRKVNSTAWPMFGAFVIGAVAQIVTSLTDERTSGTGPLSIPSTVIGWVVNSVMPLVTADPAMIREWIVQTGLLSGVLILIPLTAAATVGLVWGTARQRLLVVTLLLGSAAVYTGSAWANSEVWFQYAEQGLSTIADLQVNSRYGVASGLLLVAVIPLAAAVVVQRWRSAVWARVTATVTCVLVLGALAFGSNMTVSLRDQGDRWSPAAREAISLCDSGDAPPMVTLPVSPLRSIELSCDDVLLLSS